jgi:hypothetical protein
MNSVLMTIAAGFLFAQAWGAEWLFAGVVAFLLLGLIVAKPIRRLSREIQFERARELFSLQRERLEAKFVQLASSTGKPKGLHWEQCEFHSPVCFVRDKMTGQLSAFVGVNIRFSAVRGGTMEHVPAVGERREATAVFHYHHGQWGTGGRVLFNMNPKEAIDHFQAQYEPIPTAS